MEGLAGVPNIMFSTEMQYLIQDNPPIVDD